MADLARSVDRPHIGTPRDQVKRVNAAGGDPLCHWGIRFEPFQGPRETEAGEEIPVGCMHANGELVIWDDS